MILTFPPFRRPHGPQDYCTIAPNGLDILRVPIARLYPTDNFGDYVSNDYSRYVYKYGRFWASPARSLTPVSRLHLVDCLPFVSLSALLLVSLSALPFVFVCLLSPCPSCACVCARV